METTTTPAIQFTSIAALKRDAEKFTWTLVYSEMNGRVTGALKQSMIYDGSPIPDNPLIGWKRRVLAKSTVSLGLQSPRDHSRASYCDWPKASGTMFIPQDDGTLNVRFTSEGGHSVLVYKLERL